MFLHKSTVRAENARGAYYGCLEILKEGFSDIIENLKSYAKKHPEINLSLEGDEPIIRFSKKQMIKRCEESVGDMMSKILTGLESLNDMEDGFCRDKVISDIEWYSGKIIETFERTRRYVFGDNIF